MSKSRNASRTAMWTRRLDVRWLIEDAGETRTCQIGADQADACCGQILPSRSFSGKVGVALFLFSIAGGIRWTVRAEWVFRG